MGLFDPYFTLPSLYLRMPSWPLCPCVQAINNLTMANIIATVPPRTFNNSQKRSHVNLDLAILNLHQPDYNRLLGASVAKRCCLENTLTATPIVEEHLTTVMDEDHFFETVSVTF